MAVKFLAPDPKYIDVSAFDDIARRFIREGQRGASLRHAHLLSILEHCENEGGSAFRTQNPKNPFIIMEYVKGRTLEHYIRKQDTGDDVSFEITKPRLSIAIQIARALKHLRDEKLVHRDVKPANIFLRELRTSATWLAKLGDFGVMKWGDFHASIATGTLTVTSQKGLGTLKYMSPEQAIHPKSVTWRTDVYSLGITLFELFTGRILISAHHVYEIANARRLRGTTLSRFKSMECGISVDDSDLGELILDMFLAPDGRPSIDKICGHLEWAYERRFETTFDDDLD